MPHREPIAVIDIGSNSVRLVVYSGAPRAPSIIFNEKVLAGLGQGLDKTGELAAGPRARAMSALRRFRLLVEAMAVKQPHVLATAAVRDAKNGPAFLAEIRALGLHPQVISGEAEGQLAGMGVLSGIPDAEGIVGDLGGGSLELAEVRGGEVRKSISLPLGVLRIGEPDAANEKKVRACLADALAASKLGKKGKDRPLYLVGGSWRALARLDIISTGYPLPITHDYRMAPSRPAELRKLIANLDQADPRSLRMLTASRIPTLPAAKMVLSALVDTLGPSELVVSSFGIREGFLYQALSAAERARDPLIEATRAAGRGLSRFGEHGDTLDRWIAPIFDDGPAAARIRLAACLLADVAWAAHPDFRAERGVEMALRQLGRGRGVRAGDDGPGFVLELRRRPLLPRCQCRRPLREAGPGTRGALGPCHASRPAAERRDGADVEANPPLPRGGRRLSHPRQGGRRFVRRNRRSAAGEACLLPRVPRRGAGRLTQTAAGRTVQPIG